MYSQLGGKLFFSQAADFYGYTNLESSRVSESFSAFLVQLGISNLRKDWSAEWLLMNGELTLSYERWLAYINISLGS